MKVALTNFEMNVCMLTLSVGMERLQKSMTTYVKTLSKRNEGNDKEKILPVTYLGSTMLNHGEDFENDSEFGQCLISASDQTSARCVLTQFQAWAERMKGSDGYRKRTLRMRRQAGLSRSRDLSLR